MVLRHTFAATFFDETVLSVTLYKCQAVKSVKEKIRKMTYETHTMLSYKVTYAIQILDVLCHSREGLSVQQLRGRFVLLPVGTLISDTVRQLEAGRIICNVAPAPRGRKFRIMAALDRLTLYELAQVVDSHIVLGTPVGFSYWTPGYLEHYPKITEVEKKLEQAVVKRLQATTVGYLLGIRRGPLARPTAKRQRVTPQDKTQITIK